MVLEWNSKIVTQSLHAFVTLANPFATQLANQFRVLIKPIREDSTANVLPGFKNGDIPSRFLPLERMRGRQSRQARADNDARISSSLDEGAE